MKSQADKIQGRQLEILTRLADGEKRDSIAASLGIARSTLNSYTDRLYSRLGAHTAAQALAIYLRSKQPDLPLFLP